MTRPESSGSGLFLSNASKLTLQLKFVACFKRDEGVFRESERHRGNRACSSTVEQGTHNPLVLGSNPGGPTKTSKARRSSLLAFSFASFRYWEAVRSGGSGLCSHHKNSWPRIHHLVARSSPKSGSTGNHGGNENAARYQGGIFIASLMRSEFRLTG